MNILGRTEFGNPILRAPARRLTAGEITSGKIQTLIRDMRHTLRAKKLGVGLAAPQVGQGLALSVISIRPTAHRPDVEPFDLVLFNPVITKMIGRKELMWEGCLSAGTSGLFAQVPRHHEIEVSYFDESGQQQAKRFEGLPAHIIQHETDHLNGILFVDRVRDPKTYMTMKEYRKMIRAEKTVKKGKK